MTNEDRPVRIRTQVADVDKPLLSVAQVVHNGGREVLERGGSHIEGNPGKERIMLEQQGRLCLMKM